MRPTQVPHRAACTVDGNHIGTRAGVRHDARKSGLRRSRRGHDELNAVAERVAAFKSIESGNGDAVDRVKTGIVQALPPRCQIVNLVRHVGLGGFAVDVILDADVELLIADGNPETPAIGQRSGFVNFVEAEHSAIELPGFGYEIGRHGDLDMMNAFRTHDFAVYDEIRLTDPEFVP